MKGQMKSKLKLFIIVFYLFDKSFAMGPSFRNGCKRNYNGTTNNIKEIFIGRCHYFLNVLQVNNCLINATNYNCSDIWNEFSLAVIGKDPCSLKSENFDNLLRKVSHSIPMNTSLFWSGTYTPAHEC